MAPPSPVWVGRPSARQIVAGKRRFKPVRTEKGDGVGGRTDVRGVAQRRVKSRIPLPPSAAKSVAARRPHPRAGTRLSGAPREGEGASPRPPVGALRSRWGIVVRPVGRHRGGSSPLRPDRPYLPAAGSPCPPADARRPAGTRARCPGSRRRRVGIRADARICLFCPLFLGRCARRTGGARHTAGGRGSGQGGLSTHPIPGAACMGRLCLRGRGGRRGRPGADRDGLTVQGMRGAWPDARASRRRRSLRLPRRGDGRRGRPPPRRGAVHRC